MARTKKVSRNRPIRVPTYFTINEHGEAKKKADKIGEPLSALMRRLLLQHLGVAEDDVKQGRPSKKTKAKKES